MTFEARAAATIEAADSIFDFSRPTAANDFAANDAALLAAANPEPGWATRNPDRAALFLFVTPRECAALDELLAL